MLSEKEIQCLAERASVFAGRNLHIHIIANPVAGGFTIPKRVLAHRAAIEAALEAVADRASVVKSCDSRIHYTTAAGHAGAIAAGIIGQAERDTDPDALFCMITAGGDGTSFDVQSEYARAVLENGHRNLVGKICFIRLPFGTGNDGSDGRTMQESLSLLVEDSAFILQSAVKVTTSGTSPVSWYSFNIASIGLDAFVTHMTNKLKHRFPGDSYKLWLDIACLFYERVYKVEPIKISLSASDGSPVASIDSKLLLFLMGVSGGRTYGSNQKILPDERNVCGMKEMSLGKKLFLKKHVKAGTHTVFPEALLYTADRAEINYSGRILVQLDGESHELDQTCFPLVMERTEPFITILRKPVPKVSDV